MQNEISEIQNVKSLLLDAKHEKKKMQKHSFPCKMSAAMFF